MGNWFHRVTMVYDCIRNHRCQTWRKRRGLYDGMIEFQHYEHSGVCLICTSFLAVRIQVTHEATISLCSCLV